MGRSVGGREFHDAVCAGGQAHESGRRLHGDLGTLSKSGDVEGHGCMLLALDDDAAVGVTEGRRTGQQDVDVGAVDIASAGFGGANVGHDVGHLAFSVALCVAMYVFCAAAPIRSNWFFLSTWIGR